MWFNKKDEVNEDDVVEAPRRRRNTDIRSELGIVADTPTERVTRNKSIGPTRSNPTKGQGQADTRTVYNEDIQLNDLKVRARRRLIGALVLLTAAFIILPWVFDDQRKQAPDAVTVAVPDKNITFEVKNPNTPATAAVADNLKPTTDKKQDKAAATDTAADKPAATNTKYVVHIGIVSDSAQLASLVKRLTAAGYKPTQEKVTDNGVTKTRVRLGPFDKQADAQVAADKVKGAAKNPVVVPLE